MTIEAQESAINGELIKLTRESRGWALGDLATRACMSIRQIRQLEEGGTSSFYSLGVKVTAAKRVATLLGLTPEQVFEATKTQAEPMAESAPTPQFFAQTEAPLVLVSPNVMVSQAESDALTDVSAHLDEHVQPAALKSDNTSGQDVQPALTQSDLESDRQTPVETTVQTPATPDKPKVSLAVIVLLFAAALGVAAVMRPELESVSVESAPPVLAVPTEESPSASPSLTPASVAFAAAEPASAVASVSVAKPAVPSASAPGALGAAAPASLASQPRVAPAASVASAPGSAAKTP